MSALYHGAAFHVLSMSCFSPGLKHGILSEVICTSVFTQAFPFVFCLLSFRVMYYRNRLFKSFILKGHIDVLWGSIKTDRNGMLRVVVR